MQATPEGRMDEEDFDRQRLARKAHAAGAKILVDAAQLAPHRRVNMKPDNDRDEAGSPNVVGAVAMAAAAQVLMNVGTDNIAAHEQDLLRACLKSVA